MLGSHLSEGKEEKKESRPLANVYNGKHYISRLILEALEAGMTQLTIDLTLPQFDAYRELVSKEQLDLLRATREHNAGLIKKYIRDKEPPHIIFGKGLRNEHRIQIINDLDRDGWLFYIFSYTNHYGSGYWSRANIEDIRVDYDRIKIARRQGEVDTSEF